MEGESRVAIMGEQGRNSDTRHSGGEGKGQQALVAGTEAAACSGISETWHV